MPSGALFAPDRGLQARMVLASILTPLTVLGGVAAVVVLLPWKVAGAMGLAAIIGLSLAIREQRQHPMTRVVQSGEEPELRAAVERLCVLADLPAPELVVDRERQPNSWVVDLPGKPPRLHITRGLLDILEPRELEAVLAHEISHIAHRDATVMTLVGLPGALLGRGAIKMPSVWPLQLGALAAAVLAWVSSLGVLTLSRYRELSADAGAVALTGSAAALSAALLKVARGLTAIPREDLRVAASRDALHLMPVEARASGRHWLRKRLPSALTATHPPIARRLAALERAQERIAANSMLQR